MMTLADIEQMALDLTPEAIIEREIACGVAFGPFHRHWLNQRAPEKVRRYLERAAQRPDLVGMPSSPFRGPLLPAQQFPNANLRTAINTTTTETNLWDPGIMSRIPAYDMQAGRSYTVEFGGVMGTTSTPAISFRARCGTNNSAPPTGTDLGVGPTVTLGTFTAQPFYGIFTMGVRSIGVAASGTTLTGNGFVVMPAAAAATATPHAMIGGAIPTTVDHTADQGLSVSVIWGTNNAANTLTPQWMNPSSNG